LNIAFVHTDLRLYWPVRLKALTEYLKDDNISLSVIEIAGLGSPYIFDTQHVLVNKDWHILFPDHKIEELSADVIKPLLNGKLDSLNPDIVIAGPIAFYSGAISTSWAMKNNKKLIIFDDARIIDVKRPWWVDLIKKKIYSCVDAVFCPSPDWDSTYIYFGFKKEQIFYGVDVVDNKFWTKDRGYLENTVSGFSGRKYFLSVGRQVPKKNLLFLLNAYSKYRQLHNNPLSLVLVGEGTETEKVSNFILKHDLNEVVEMQPFLTPGELKSVYQNASWFILPSIIGETWGLVVNEAMAAGLPVLVSDQAGCANVLVKEGVNGFVFSPENGDALADLLYKVSKMDETDRRSFCKSSAEIISEWDLDRFCKGITEAVKFVSLKQKADPDLISKLLIKFWKGRYRPL
jgi:glycosyltransferase involved in cell wall biosynthesis